MEAWMPAALRGNAAVDLKARLVCPKIPSGKAREILLHDKSFDKRWAFLAERICKCIAAEEGVIFLVPDVSYLKFIEARLRERVSCPVVVWDRKAPLKKELEQWLMVREAQAALVLGTRSAVFAPLPRPGLIVIYDEESAMYKQQQTPHYHVHEIARMRSREEGCEVMYVSSAPSAEVWEGARKKKWPTHVLEADRLSPVQVVDMTNYNPRRSSILSFPLQDSIQKVLAEGGRVVLLMNRKGFSTRTHCNQCGFTLKCQRCDVNLTYLYAKKIMACRHCHLRQELPKVCPQCHGAYLRSTGTGVEKLESEAARLYPQARVGRYDSDSGVFPEEADIVITTQAVLKVEGRLRFDLVAVIHFDAELHHQDFRCAQKAFSLLVHLRQMAGKKMLIQTRISDNYCLEAVRRADFECFYKTELKYRKELGLPPYNHLVAVGIRGRAEDVVFNQAADLAKKMEDNRPKGVEVSDPHPDVNPKLRDKYRFTIILKGKSVKGILAFAQKMLKGFGRKRRTVMTVNVDP
jgi:primosomal protein N' (replication factor Y)